MAASSELEKRAKKLVVWNDRLDRSVDRMADGIQRVGEPLHRQVGGAALAFLHMGANMAISVPGAISELRFSRQAKKELGARREVTGLSAARALLMRDVETFEKISIQDGEVLEVDELAKRIADPIAEQE